MFVYLLRHGDAAQDASLRDAERPLTDLGHRQAQTVARYFHRLKISINTIYCSPLLRARQMGAPAREALRVENFILTEYLVPGNDVRQLLEQINAQPSESILLVGHEPYMSELTASLIGGTTDTKIEYKKASLCLLQATPPLRKGHGLLKWLITIEQMEMALS